MPVIKLGDLTTFTGDASGSWLVMNDPTNTTTYKVDREQLLSGSTVATASYAVNAANSYPKFWLYNETKSLQDNETLVISDNYVLKNAVLILTGSSEQYTVGNIVFGKQSQIFIGGHMLLVDSNVINDGQISVAGGIILSGSSTITGNGTII